jgi:hypothetical protein
MHSPAITLIKSHHAELLKEAEANRLANLARNARLERTDRVAAALEAVRSIPAKADWPIVAPKLIDYPYRS